MEIFVPKIKLLVLFAMRYYSVFVLVCTFLVSCNSAISGDVELSPFCTEIVESYCNCYPRVYVKEPAEIYLSVSFDKEYCYLNIWGDNSTIDKEYPFSLRNYLGRTSVCNKPVFVGGPVKSIFYKATRHRASPIKGEVCEYDPFEWRIAIRKCDTTYCLMKSNSNSPFVNVSIIDSIALKYFKPSIMTGDEIYPNYDLDIVATPPFSYEERVNLIADRYSFIEVLPNNKSIVVDLIIDKNGNASLYNIEKKSGIKHFDQEALRMAKDICEYKFRPAQIRGENVNTIYVLCFHEKGLVFL